ncbi:MAG: phosphoglucosamine mutase [Fusobacteriota bacterium]
MARKYFGTDGIRGEANKDLTVDIAMRLGYALGHYLKERKGNDESPVIVFGTDTRISGYMLRSAIFAGLTSLGVNIEFVGVIPTPGVSYLTKYLNADAGIMMSASHNPAKDNGIKIFGSDGFKLSDETEEKLELLMDDIQKVKKGQVAGDKVGKFRYNEDQYYTYQDFLINAVTSVKNFKGMKIILDTANGAAYKIASRVFYELGAEIVAINDKPNGTNINVRCGSTDMNILKKVVLGYEADLGLAFDGDADRLLAIDDKGNEIDGDKIIGLLAKDLKEQNKLNKNTVVTTIMSNMGFEKYLKDNGIDLLRAQVGDRYVLEKMKEEGLNLGGEQSGHIINANYNTTGDGMLTALKLVSILKNQKQKLSELAKAIPKYPQTLINIIVDKSKKEQWKNNPKIINIIESKKKELKDKGRIIVRTSGTEPKIRVMTEGENEKKIKKVAKEISEVIKEELS